MQLQLDGWSHLSWLLHSTCKLFYLLHENDSDSIWQGNTQTLISGCVFIEGKKYTSTNSLLQLSARIFLYYKIHKTLLKLIPSPWSYFIPQSVCLFVCLFWFLPWYWTRCKAPTISLMGAKKSYPFYRPIISPTPPNNFKFLYIIF